MLTSITGINWGDEGKGRMVDLLSQDYDIVARYQGGDNAGHTVKNERGKFVLNLIPSGILRPDVVCVMGGGKRIIAVASTLVPFMGGLYVLVALIVIVMNLELVPTVFARIFQGAFDFQAIFAGFTGSALMQGIKQVFDPKGILNPGKVCPTA